MTNILIPLLGPAAISLLTYSILEGSVIEFLNKNPLYAYSICMVILSFFLVFIIAVKYRRFTPSAGLLLFFISVPLIGSYRMLLTEEVEDYYHSLSKALSYPIYVWAAGMATFFIGVSLYHALGPKLQQNPVVSWKKYPSLLLYWMTLGGSAIFTVYVLINIGYVPALQPNIDLIRGTGVWDNLAGEYPIKLSRLWLVTVPMSIMFAFSHKRLIYIGIAMFGCIALMMYGQREYTFLAIATLLLVYSKYKRISTYFVVFLTLTLITSFTAFAQYRAGQYDGKMSALELTVANMFGEWPDYVRIVNDISESGKYYHENIFVGSLVPLMPKQIWDVVGVDKNKMIHKYSAAYVFGTELDRKLGIRIGTIGEAFAGYGLYLGVCVQMLLFGLIFGHLEKNYYNLDKCDVRICLCSFLMSLLLFLPLTTLFVTTTNFVFFAPFFIFYSVIGGQRCHYRRVGDMNGYFQEG